MPASERTWAVLRYIDDVEVNAQYYLAQQMEDVAELVHLTERRHNQQLKMWGELLELTRYRPPENRFLDRTMVIIGVAAVLLLIVTMEVVAVSK